MDRGWGWMEASSGGDDDGGDGAPVEPMTGRELVPPRKRLGHEVRDESNPVLEYSHVEDGTEFFVVGDTSGSVMVPREMAVSVEA